MPFVALRGFGLLMLLRLSVGWPCGAIGCTEGCYGRFMLLRLSVDWPRGSVCSI